MKKSIENITVLVCICAVVSVLLAVTNAVTAPFIAANEVKKANAALLEVMPDGNSFELLDISSYKLPATVREAYKSENGGYVIKLNTTGYASGMVLMCGVSADGKVTGAKLISSNETPAIGGTAANTMAQNVVGKDDKNIDTVDTIGGATKTTAAYRAAVKDALNAAIILGGGEADIRTEEEILAENLMAALPAGDGTFEVVFRTEVTEGVDKIYKATNGAGYVCVIGEEFIGLDGEGNVLSDVSEETATTVKIAVEAIIASKTTDIDLTQYQGLPTQLISAQRTETGNYENVHARLGLHPRRKPRRRTSLSRHDFYSFQALRRRLDGSKIGQANGSIRGGGIFRKNRRHLTCSRIGTRHQSSNGRSNQMQGTE